MTLFYSHFAYYYKIKILKKKIERSKAKMRGKIMNELTKWVINKITKNEKRSCKIIKKSPLFFLRLIELSSDFKQKTSVKRL